ncbi:MAG: aspartate--tRNA ligase [Planctomycetota bacterium]|jgi:aspartyl-tRNA synthetase
MPVAPTTPDFAARTHTCGQLRSQHTSSEVTLAGWVDSYRNQGKGLIFVDVRDREGVTQIVFDEEDSGAELCQLADTMRVEDVIVVSGLVRERASSNPRLGTGEVEVVASGASVLSKAESLPFHPTDPDSLPNEEIRLRSRHLDLRRPRMQQILRTRHKVSQAMRRYLDDQGFLEVETPILCKSTPEGARDFLVPSRLQAGEFYALPQSPQIFKQILMCSGCERYFQLARCFRDEDPRADRQAEFTQLDVEMSFVDRESVLDTVSGLFRAIWKGALDVEIGEIPRMSYQEAMDRFGIDRPDTRFDLELVDVGDIASQTEFKVFQGVLAEGGVVKAIRIPGGTEKLTRKNLDTYAEFVKQFGVGGLPYTKIEGGAFATGVARFIEPVFDALRERLGFEDGDVLVFGVGTYSAASKALGELRNQLARDLELLPASGERWNFLWVVDFPLVEWNEDNNRWDSLHHPFTSPVLSELDKLDSDPASVISEGYDLVLNGSEVAGGSIRIHSQDVQSKVFSLLGLTKEDAEHKFGFLLDALRHGAPPHGGIAVGLDRVVMHLCNTDNIRDVIAFPKTQTGADLLSGAPSTVDEAQLQELSIATTIKAEP